MAAKDTCCSYCGQRFPEDQGWPRQCVGCGRRTYRNPIPVAVVLVPVDDGLLLIRRAIAPHIGGLALPGGYIGWDETWQEAGAREVWEETGLRLDPGTIRDFGARADRQGFVLIFGLAPPQRASDIPPVPPAGEVSECVIARGLVDLVFSLHAEAMRAFFSAGQL
ncbi:MAG TPA: NUDIX domain-containing protein [Chloroflexia bacterium]|nr:NUDIX domain-containing protein [Chloroflexia bacterium]